MNASFTKKDEAEYETPWTACGASVVAFVFNTQLKLTLQNQAASNASGFVEPILSQNFDLTWMRCKR